MEQSDDLGAISRLVVTGVLKSHLAYLLPQSTVMLAVDVSFLAIPGVVPYSLQGDVSSKTSTLVSLSETATIISLGASVGSNIISLLLMRHNRAKQDVDPKAAVSEQLNLVCMST